MNSNYPAASDGRLPVKPHMEQSSRTIPSHNQSDPQETSVKRNQKHRLDDPAEVESIAKSRARYFWNPRYHQNT